MRTNLQKRNEGFTIIEVMIVLAIAGLIMLIVFLAVPALQRNSRNTQRKNDVANIAAAVNEWSQNNKGALPKDTTEVAAAGALAKPGFYTIVNTFSEATSTTGVANTATVDTYQLVMKAKCGSVTPSGAGATPVAASATSGSARSFVMLYAVEDASGNAVRQCQEG